MITAEYSEQNKSGAIVDESGEVQRRQANGALSPLIKQLRGRKLYILLRGPKIREEIKALSTTRKQLAEAAGAETEPEPGKLRKLNEQRIYITHELARLKAELATLEIERGDIAKELKEAGQAANLK